MTGITDCDYTSSESIKRYTKALLKNTLFIGILQEKRYVEVLSSYRYVVCVSSEEEDFIKNLVTVKKRLEEDILKTPWIGITGPEVVGAPKGYSLWVDLSDEVFGKYWYKVKNVEFMSKEIRLKLDIIRPVKRETIFSNKNENGNDISEYAKEINQIFKEKLFELYKILTFENVKKSVIFIFLLLSTLVLACINAIHYFLEYILKLIREMSNLIQASTPIVINLFNMISRIIFGLYQLIFALFQKKPQPQPVYNSYYSVSSEYVADYRTRYNKYFNKSIPYYRSNSGVKIIPLDD